MRMDDILCKRPSDIAYLAGAGISIPPPSALPSASAFISSLANTITKDPNLQTAILDRTFTSDSDKRFVGDFLRFEAVMGCIKLAIDPELQILRIYSDSNTPNSYHFYLANQLNRGAIVLTTNFDNLIEIACRTSGVDYSLVVSDEKLETFSANPSSFKNPVIKLHGGFDLIDSRGRKRQGAENVKTTLEQVGKVYLSSRPNQLTSALSTVIRTRHMVIIGYSGCDDFDIMPGIMEERPLKGLTWIDHSDQPVEVLRQPPQDSPDLPPYRLLAEHSQKQSDIKIIRGSTATILGIDMNEVNTNERYDWTNMFANWSEKYLVSEAHRRLLLGQILIKLDRFEEGAETLEDISRDTLSQEQLGALYLILSCLYVYLNDNKRAILSLSEIAESQQKIEGISLKGFAYFNLARINTNMGQYAEAEMYINAAMKIFKQGNDLGRIADCFHERGRIYIDTENNDEAIKCIESSVKIAERIGDLTGVAIGYNEIARALTEKGNFDEAKVYIGKAIRIYNLYGDNTGLGITHHTYGYILAMEKDYIGAAHWFKKAIEYERSAGAKLDLAHSLHSLGDMYIGMKELDKAKKCVEESLKIKREINDRKGITNSELLLQVIELMKMDLSL
ncbi:MAG: tetratricopeptide repeat protein [Methanomassiliicoccales archaeon]|nr:MAG: tetratricopeptide repeat protein [Methanomassiliicoccales archaeon]